MSIQCEDGVITKIDYQGLPCFKITINVLERSTETACEHEIELLNKYKGASIISDFMDLKLHKEEGYAEYICPEYKYSLESYIKNTLCTLKQDAIDEAVWNIIHQLIVGFEIIVKEGIGIPFISMKSIWLTEKLDVKIIRLYYSYTENWNFLVPPSDNPEFLIAPELYEIMYGNTKKVVNIKAVSQSIAFTVGIIISALNKMYNNKQISDICTKCYKNYSYINEYVLSLNKQGKYSHHIPELIKSLTAVQGRRIDFFKACLMFKWERDIEEKVAQTMYPTKLGSDGGNMYNIENLLQKNDSTYSQRFNSTIIEVLNTEYGKHEKDKKIAINFGDSIVDHLGEFGNKESEIKKKELSPSMLFSQNSSSDYIKRNMILPPHDVIPEAIEEVNTPVHQSFIESMTISASVANNQKNNESNQIITTNPFEQSSKKYSPELEQNKESPKNDMHYDTDSPPKPVDIVQETPTLGNNDEAKIEFNDNDIQKIENDIINESQNLAKSKDIEVTLLSPHPKVSPPENALSPSENNEIIAPNDIPADSQELKIDSLNDRELGKETEYNNMVPSTNLVGPKLDDESASEKADKRESTNELNQNINIDHVSNHSSSHLNSLIGKDNDNAQINDSPLNENINDEAIKPNEIPESNENESFSNQNKKTSEFPKDEPFSQNMDSIKNIKTEIQKEPNSGSNQLESNPFKINEIDANLEDNKNEDNSMYPNKQKVETDINDLENPSEIKASQKELNSDLKINEDADNNIPQSQELHNSRDAHNGLNSNSEKDRTMMHTTQITPVSIVQIPAEENNDVKEVPINKNSVNSPGTVIEPVSIIQENGSTDHKVNDELENNEQNNDAILMIDKEAAKEEIIPNEMQQEHNGDIEKKGDTVNYEGATVLPSKKQYDVSPKKKPDYEMVPTIKRYDDSSPQQTFQESKALKKNAKSKKKNTNNLVLKHMSKLQSGRKNYAPELEKANNLFKSIEIKSDTSTIRAKKEPTLTMDVEELKERIADMKNKINEQRQIADVYMRKENQITDYIAERTKQVYCLPDTNNKANRGL